MTPINPSSGAWPTYPWRREVPRPVLDSCPAVRRALGARPVRREEELAALNILIAMAGFAAFVLFFERPMNNAAFWIALAAGVRLAETSRPAGPQGLVVGDQLRRGSAPTRLTSGPEQFAGFGNAGLSRPRFGPQHL
jgi:hypothetical protein